MNLDGRRQSTNVEDRRGLKVGKAGGLSLGGLLVAGILYLVLGIDVTPALQQAGSMTTTQTETGYTPSAQEEELAVFAKQILAGTEDVWTKIFSQSGLTYQPPKLVLYNDYVQTSTGTASAQVGPFYNSADQTVYLDLSFFTNMKKDIGADGDFAYAYVIAHEVGHHVQYLLGTLGDAHSKMARMSETESNKMSVRIELQADYYAGVWGYHENDMYKSLDDGDLREAIDCAEVIGDNYLQKKAGGTVQPDLFTHGTSAQRMKWLKAGLTSGDIRGGDTFSCNYNQL